MALANTLANYDKLRITGVESLILVQANQVEIIKLFVLVDIDKE
jgi:hypothetical protein